MREKNKTVFEPYHANAENLLLTGQLAAHLTNPKTNQILIDL